jgi:membrane protein
MEDLTRYVLWFRQSPVGQLIIQTFLKWQEDDCMQMGAALAYYALFSLFPLLLLTLGIFGAIAGPDSAVHTELLQLAQKALPGAAFDIIEGTLTQLNEGSTTAGILGGVILLVTASGFFGALNRAFNKIWRVQNEQAADIDLVAIARGYILRRAFSFALVLGAVVLLFASLLSQVIIGLILEIAQESVNERLVLLSREDFGIWNGLNSSVSFLIATAAIMAMLKILPLTRVAWRDVWLGGLITAILLSLLNYLVSNSIISLGSRFQSYGVVGGVMVLMLWIYLTSQVMFIGGEISYIYAHIFGSRRRMPKPW